MSDTVVIGADELPQVLYKLQGSGCQVGIAGAVPPEAYRCITRAVTKDDLPRHEVVGYVGSEGEAAEWIDKPTNDMRDTKTSVVRLDHDRRITDDKGNWAAVPPRQEVYQCTQTFLESVAAKLADIRARGYGGMIPMLSCYPVGYFADELDWDAVMDFVDATGHHIRETSGIGFYHFDRGVRNSGLRDNAEIFDALVLLRSERVDGDRMLKHKWHIKKYQLSTDQNLETEWLSLPSGGYIG